MCEELTPTLVMHDLTSSVDRSLLRVVVRTGPRRAWGLDVPPAIRVGNNVPIVLAHVPIRLVISRAPQR